MTSSFLPSFLPSFFLLLARHHLPARDCSETCRTSSAASLGCTCQFLIAVGLAGLLQRDSFCGPRRTFTARKSLWASPNFLRLENRCGLRRTFTPRKSLWASPDFSCLDKTQKECQTRMPEKMPERMSDGMPDKMSEIECQIECQIKRQR